MITKKAFLAGLQEKKLVWIGLAFGIGYYFVDALVDALISDAQSFAGQVFHPAGADLWTRVSILVIATLFGIYAHRSVRRIRAAERFLDTVIENIPDMIFIKDAGTLRFVRINRAAEKLLGFKAAELIGKNDHDFFPREQAEQLMDKDRQVLASGTELDIPEEMFETRHRRQRFLHTRKLPILDDNGKPEYLLGIASDITSEKIARSVLIREKQRTDRYLQISQAMIVSLDRRGVITQINQRGCEILGYQEDELLGKNWFDMIIPQAERDSVRKVFDRIISGELQPVRNHENAVLTSNGEQRVIYWNNEVQKDRHGEVTGTLSSGQDITERKQAEEQLRLSATVFESTSQGIVVTDSKHRTVSVNPAFTAITGYRLEDVRDHPPSFLQSGFHDDAFYRELWETVDRQGSWKGEIWDRRRDGEAYPTWQTISAIRGADRAVTHYVSVFSDITPIKQSQANLDFLAHHDPMTGLPNRLMFADRLDHACKRHQRNHNTLALYFLDLDGFKQVNDSLGHSAGDRLLQTVAERLQAMLRDEDTVARFGGDEFVILLESAESRSALERIAGKIIDEVARPVLIDGEEVCVSTSIGISVAPGDGSDGETLLRCADKAMYQAKASGSSQFRFFRPA